MGESAQVVDSGGTANHSRSDMHTTDSFTALKETNSINMYKQVGVELVTFIVSAALGTLPQNVKPKVPDDQKQIARSYYDALSRGTGEGDQLLQHLLYATFTHNARSADPKGLPFYRFLILYSFRRDGSLDACNNITQVISKIVFFARACIYNEIKREMKTLDEGFFA